MTIVILYFFLIVRQSFYYNVVKYRLYNISLVLEEFNFSNLFNYNVSKVHLIGEIPRAKLVSRRAYKSPSYFCL